MDTALAFYDEDDALLLNYKMNVRNVNVPAFTGLVNDVINPLVRVYTRSHIVQRRPKRFNF